MPKPIISITLAHPVIAEIDARGEARSTTIARDLERLYALYKLALRDVPLAEREAMLLVDVLNGTLMDAATAAVLWGEIEDGITLNGLAAKWEIDGADLVRRLKALDNLHALALIDAAERYWCAISSGGQPEVKQFFHVHEV